MPPHGQYYHKLAFFLKPYQHTEMHTVPLLRRPKHLLHEHPTALRQWLKQRVFCLSILSSQTLAASLLVHCRSAPGRGASGWSSTVPGWRLRVCPTPSAPPCRCAASGWQAVSGMQDTYWALANMQSLAALQGWQWKAVYEQLRQTCCSVPVQVQDPPTPAIILHSTRHCCLVQH